MTTETKHMPSEREIEAVENAIHDACYPEHKGMLRNLRDEGQAEIRKMAIAAISQSRAPDQSERVRELEEQLHYANGVAELAMKHRDEAEAALAEARKVIEQVEQQINYGQPAQAYNLVCCWRSRNGKLRPHEERCAQNTDREIYREPDTTGHGAFYSDSIHVTENGGISINCGGRVIVLPLREWHARAIAASPPAASLTRTQNMAETMKLLPCPFCGGVAAFRPVRVGHPDGYIVACTSDDCFGPQTTAIGDDAVVQWNTRATAVQAGAEDAMARTIFESVKAWAIAQDPDCAASRITWTDQSPEADSGREMFRIAARAALNALIPVRPPTAPNRPDAEMVAQINALPQRLRDYIHHIETDCDPQGTIRENFLLREENERLRAECERLSASAGLRR